MTIEEIFQLATSNDVITELKSRRFIPQPDTATARHELDIKLHGVHDPIRRPDKRVRVTDDNDGESAQKVIQADGESSNFKTEPVARVALALQKLIINRAVSFLFGNPVLYNNTPETDNEKMVAKALERILYDVKSNSVNRRVARALFSYKEVAELWYPVEQENDNYGFHSAFKLKCAVFSPMFGDTLWPYFDDSGDMVAFSREFSKTDHNNVVTDYFETYTADEHWLWTKAAQGFTPVDGYPKKTGIGKIPVIYGHQRQFETEDVDGLIDRLEFLLSNFADTNDYHAAPKIFVTGQINGWSKKGESGAVIEGEDGATMQYVSWQSAPESVKLEIETLLKMIYTITQTPDISWDAVKGLNVSGVALKLLFMDAHLKVQDKREVFDEYLQRRVNVLLAYIGQFNTAITKETQTLQIEPEIVPYIITSEADELNYWMTANGNNPVISQAESIERAGLSQNPELTLQKIQAEQASANTFNIGEPTYDA